MKQLYMFMALLNLSLVYSALHAQLQTTFQAKIDGLCTYSEGGFSSMQTFDGGYIVSGITACHGQGSFDVSVIKMDSAANIEWANVYGGSSQDYGYKVIQTFDSAYVIGGYVKNLGAGVADALLMKLDSKGDTLWTKTYGLSSQDYGRNVIQTQDHGFLLVGSTRDTLLGDDNIYLVKTDSMGNLLWSKSYGGPGTESGNSVIEYGDSGYVVVGYTNSYGIGENDMVLLKTNTNGDLEWSKIIGTPETDEATDVCLDRNSLVICGTRTYPYTIGNYTCYIDNVYLIRFNIGLSANFIAWAKNIGTEEHNEKAYSLHALSDGGFVIGGEQYSPGFCFPLSPSNFLSVKTDSLGDIVWSKGYRTTNNAYDYGGYLSLTKENGFLLCGQSQDTLGGKNYDICLIKTDKNGKTACEYADVSLPEKDISLTITDTLMKYSDLPIQVFSGLTVEPYANYEQTEYCFESYVMDAEYISKSICGSDTVFFYDSSIGSSYWSWNFGDGWDSLNNTSSLQHPFHVYSQEGTYTVTLVITDSLGINKDTVTKTIEVYDAPSFSLLKDTTVCPGTYLSLNTNGSQAYDYSWNSGGTLPYEIVQINSSSIIYVTVTNGNCEQTDSMTVSIFDNSNCVITGDTIVCEEQSLTLYAGSGYSSYLWNTGSIDSTITISQAGIYIVSTINKDGCASTDSIVIFDAVSCTIIGDTIACESNPATLSAGSNFSSYLWNTGSVDSSITVMAAGIYSVTVWDQNGCSSIDSIVVTDCENSSIESIEGVKNREVQLYPNPIESGLFIKANEKPQKVELLDIYGRKITEFSEADLLDDYISFLHISNGPYIIRIHFSINQVNQLVIKDYKNN